MGFAPFQPDRDADHAFGNVKSHKLARLVTQKTRRLGKENLGILQIEEDTEEEESGAFAPGSFGAKSFADVGALQAAVSSSKQEETSSNQNLQSSAHKDGRIPGLVMGIGMRIPNLKF